MGAAGSNYINHEKGLWSWLTTIDHKRIGLMYFLTIMVFSSWTPLPKKPLGALFS